MKKMSYLYFLLVGAMVLMMGLIGSCKQKKNSQQNQSITWKDISIGYPGIDVQRERLEKFSEIFNRESVFEKSDGILKQLILEVPLKSVRRYLEQLGKEPSAKTKPNIPILLARISEIQSIDENEVSQFIQKNKETHNVDALCISLSGLKTESMRTKAADALASLGDSNAVPILNFSLYYAAGLHSGGTESQLSRQQYRRSLTGALASCTGLDFSDYDASEAATLKVLKRCQDWLEETGRL